MIKKNDFATFIVYIGMLVIALAVAFFGIRPVIEHTANSLPVHYVVLVILGLLTGIIINSLLIEFGHLLGAEVGKYKVYRFNILGFTFEDDKKSETKKRNIKFSGPEGLTGDTKVLPLDREKSTLSAYILFPFLAIIIEFIIFVVFIVNAQNAVGASSGYKGDLAQGWIIIFGEAHLAVTGMIVFYDIFPARLESITDGFLLSILTKPINKVAYNDLLVREEALYYKETPKPLPIYKDLSDLTYLLNNAVAYEYMQTKHYEEAIKVFDLAINCERGLVKIKKTEALCNKFVALALLLKEKEFKTIYENFDDATKGYISNLNSLAALKSYLLISGLIESSENEAEYALGKAGRLLKQLEKEEQPLHVDLINQCVDLVKRNHPSWEIALDFAMKEDEKEEEEVEEVEEVLEEVEEDEKNDK